VADLSTEGFQCFSVAGDSVVIKMSLNNTSQPSSLFRDRAVTVSQQGLAYVLDFLLQTLADGLTLQREPSVFPFPCADVGKSEKPKGFRLPLASFLTVGSGKTTELDEPGFVLMQYQSELGQSFR
jgi:hypothetical protein